MSLASASQGADPFADLVVACVQMQPHVGHKAENLERSVQMIERSAARGARVIVLPELASSGYAFASREEAFAAADPVPEGDATRAWTTAAQRLNVYVVGGVAERVADVLYNAAVVVGPRGPIGCYRKLHLWGDENLFFEPGDIGLPVFDTEVGRLAALICYDGWFPETYRLLAMQGADLVCVPTNWVPMPGQPPAQPAMANTLTMAAAHSNGLNIACANRIGVERGQPFIGQSLIVGSDGWPLAGPASADREEILIARMNLKTTRRARQLNAFNHVLRDRRTDLYDPMLGTGWPRPRT
jgi:N-carbamoylputrescine amidase